MRRTSAATTRTERKLHHVARHQFGRGYGFPRAVASDRRVQREPRLQRGKGRLGAALLEQPERGIEHQKTGDDRGLDIFAEHQLEHDRGLEHPRNGRPELSRAPCAMDAALVSGIAFGPNFSSRRRASSPVRPLAGSPGLGAPVGFAGDFLIAVGVLAIVIISL